MGAKRGQLRRDRGNDSLKLLILRFVNAGAVSLSESALIQVARETGDRVRVEITGIVHDESSHPELCSEVAGGVTRNIVCLF